MNYLPSGLKESCHGRTLKTTLRMASTCFSITFFWHVKFYQRLNFFSKCIRCSHACDQFENNYCFIQTFGSVIKSVHNHVQSPCKKKCLITPFQMTSCFLIFVNFPSRVNASNDHLKIKNDQVHMVSRSYIKICANYQ